MRLGVLTSGGDAPGMNAAVWAAARAGTAAGHEVVGIRHGWPGLLEGEALPLDPDATAGWVRRGGTWLGTARLPDFPSRLAAVAAAARQLGLDGLLVIGGGGSLAAAGLLARSAGLPVAGLAGTIDNDVAGTDATIGFDTALTTAIEMADRLRDTAEALPRLFALETLGGDTGYLAEAVARLTGADLLLAREAPVGTDDAIGRLRPVLERRGHALVVASEGYPDGVAVLERISTGCGTRLRMTRLGHAQRGGPPSPRDRALAIAGAEAAVAALIAGDGGLAALRAGRIEMVPLPDAAALPPFPALWRGLL